MLIRILLRRGFYFWVWSYLRQRLGNPKRIGNEVERITYRLKVNIEINGCERSSRSEVARAQAIEAF